MFGRETDACAGVVWIEYLSLAVFFIFVRYLYTLISILLLFSVEKIIKLRV